MVLIKGNKKKINKINKYSEPNKKLKHFFIWPEGIFSGFSYEELQILKEFFEEISQNHYSILVLIN